MKKIFVFIFLLTLNCLAFSQQIEAYNIFNAKSQKITVNKMLKNLEKADIILFGEYHNNPISHWLEYEVANYLINKKKKIVLGAEMFEADNQDILNRYLNFEIDDKAFDTLARLWPNYKTDYSPLVLLAKRTKTKFIATNIPRRYAAMVHKGGFEALDSLSKEEKQWMADLPIEYEAELPGYKAMLNMKMGHGSENLPKAQAIKDASMAYFINKHLDKNHIFLHINGAYHSNNYEGIYWYLKRINPELNIITITTISQTKTNKLEKENQGIADFTICVNENMTATY